MSLRQRLQRVEAAVRPMDFIRMPGESEGGAMVRAAVAKYGLEHLVILSFKKRTLTEGRPDVGRGDSSAVWRHSASTA